MINTNVGDMPLDIFSDYISDILDEEWYWQYIVFAVNDGGYRRGNGYGSGIGYRHGIGYEYGYGYGSGFGYVNGYGHGSGIGYGRGNGHSHKGNG
jgi:hypothetical protein